LYEFSGRAPLQLTSIRFVYFRSHLKNLGRLRIRQGENHNQPLWVEIIYTDGRAIVLRLTSVPAKDIYHDSVKNALIKDQWTITHDSLTLRVGKKDMFVDLGAEKFLAAQKQDRKIAVEIKSFIGASEIEDLRNALGQYILYENALELVEPDRILYLAIRELIFYDLFEEVIGKYLLEKRLLKIVVFDPDSEVIVKWID